MCDPCAPCVLATCVPVCLVHGVVPTPVFESVCVPSPRCRVYHKHARAPGPCTACERALRYMYGQENMLEEGPKPQICKGTGIRHANPFRSLLRPDEAWLLAQARHHRNKGCDMPVPF